MGTHLGQTTFFAQLLATVIGLVVIYRLIRGPAVAPWKIALVAGGCLALAVVSFMLSDPPLLWADYRTGYYLAGKDVLQSPAALRPLTAEGALGFAGMPIIAYAFAPLAALPVQMGGAIYAVAGVIAIVAAWWLLARMTGLALRERLVLALLFVANGPLQYSLREGNLTHFVLLTLIGGLALVRAKRSIAAGVLLGLTAVIKPPLLLFGLFFLLRRDWRAVVSFGAAFGLVALGSIAAFGWQDNYNWVQLCIVRYSHDWLAAFNDQSLQSFLFRLRVGPAYSADWTPYPPLAGEKLLGSALTAAIYLSFLLALINPSFLRGMFKPPAQVDPPGQAEVRRDLQYLLIPSLMLVSSPLEWSHYFAWLLIPTAFFLASGPHFPCTPVVRILGWAAICLTTPLVRPLSFSNPEIMSLYWRFGVSIYLFGGAIWYGLIAWSLARSGGLLTPSKGRTRPATVPSTGSPAPT